MQCSLHAIYIIQNNIMKKLRSIYLLTVLAGALFIAGCTLHGKDKSEVEEISQFPVLTLQTTDTVVKSSYVADIEAIKNIEIRSRVKGFLEKIYVDEGKAVSQGQLLFKL